MTQGASGRYKNLVDATLTIARTEGWAAFMSGWQPRLIWISLGGFVFFPALEAAKRAFGPAGGLLTPPPPESGFVIEELEMRDLKTAREKGRGKEE
jgi:solute carrier family 25 S-adenosylmethionine transporter 26